MSEEQQFEITPEAQAMLNKLSLISYVNISNSFTGLYLTEQLRIWYCKAEIRLGNHRITFNGIEGRPAANICDAIRRTFSEVHAYIKAHPDLKDYWDEIE